MVGRLKAHVLRAAERGNIRACIFLLTTLDPSFMPPKPADVPEPQTKYIIIRNGPPDMPSEYNNWGEEPKPNGEDVQHEPEDGGAAVPGPSVLDRQMRDEPN